MEEHLRADLNKAQLDKDELKVSTLRLLLSEIHNAQIAKGAKLEDKDVIAVIQRELKKRKEAAAAFRSGGRESSSQKEEDEAAILESYLPEQLSNEELTKVIEQVINELGAKSLSDMGKVVAKVIAGVGQSADGGRVSSLVREKLSDG